MFRLFGAVLIFLFALVISVPASAEPSGKEARMFRQHFQFSILDNYPEQLLAGPADAVLQDDNGRSVDGLAIGLIMGCNRDVSVLNLGTVNIVSRHMQGIQLGFMNVSGDVSGVQLGVINSGAVHGIKFGLVNVNNADSRGLMIGVINGFDNLALEADHSAARGLQLAILNSADSFHGVQLGLINYVRTLDGLQIGLVNIVKDADKILPLLHWKF